ncbi:hypothetical protein V6N13_071888 [Hibiscus sabdariffa]|uniref:Uncharacterized protein n=1 Tax=Hibiscus sabdariffa TaxID=183260 RepID=A0ABR2TC38_9ROSI
MISFSKNLLPTPWCVCNRLLIQNGIILESNSIINEVFTVTNNSKAYLTAARPAKSLSKPCDSPEKIAPRSVQSSPPHPAAAPWTLNLTKPAEGSPHTTRDLWTSNSQHSGFIHIDKEIIFGSFNLDIRPPATVTVSTTVTGFNHSLDLHPSDKPGLLG